MKYKIEKNVTEFNIEFATNGYILRYNGRDKGDDYLNETLLIGDLQALYREIERLDLMPRE